MAHGTIRERSGDTFPANGPDPTLTLESSIDLQGRPSAEQLIVEGAVLQVIDDSRQTRRKWQLSQVRGFRIDSLVGSCFLQAEVAGQWVDVLRRAGTADAELSDAAQRLDAWCREGCWPGEHSNAPPGAVPLGGPQVCREVARGPANRLGTARRLVELLAPFGGNVALLLVLSIVAVAIELVPPMLQGMMVDQVLTVEAPPSRTGQLLILLSGIVLGLLLVRATSAVVGIWKGRVSSRVGTTLTANLREELVRKLNQLPLAFHDRHQVGALMSRVAYDTETLHTLVYHVTGGFLLQTLQLVGIAVMMLHLNPKLAVVTMLPMPLIAVGGWYFTRYLNPRHNHYWEAVERQASALTGMLSGMRVVKSFVQEDREVARFQASSRRLRDSRQTVDVSIATFTSLMGLIFAAGMLAVWYLGGRDVLLGGMTLGSLTAFFGYLAMFYTPLTTIGESTTWFSSFFVTMRRVLDLLAIPSEAQPTERETPRERIQGRVEFQDVSFGYDKGRPVLHNIRFTIEPGQMIGIVGRSGSGKSTLVSLIGRLYEADGGRVLVDGMDVRAMAVPHLRRCIGMVLQEPFLFRGLVSENIAYGNPQADPRQILRAARCADAHAFIMRMPLAYETQLGEGGSGLSAGERQRLSIARALVFDPAILILDEATASVDAESERAICEAVRRFSRRRTTIAIAHRLSTLRHADRLLVFDQGQLIEQGTHEELLAHGGVYSTLFSLQWNLHEGRRRVESAMGSRGPGGANGWDGQMDGESPLPGLFPADASPGLPRPGGASSAAEDDDELRGSIPAQAAIEEDGDASLCLRLGEQAWQRVYAVCAFPASHPEEFISLRRCDPSAHEIELGTILRLDDWPRAAQVAVRRSLDRRYLLGRVREIRQVRTQGNRLTLHVLTDTGASKLELEKPGEGFQTFGKQGLLLVDAARRVLGHSRPGQPAGPPAAADRSLSGRIARTTQSRKCKVQNVKCETQNGRR